MANMRNKWEFYGSILEALGVDYTDAELKNNETLRAKLLEGLGVEHTYDDVNQYPLWREKLVEGVGNMSGGGVTWNTVFEGNATTTERNGRFMGIVGNALSGTAESIKVTFNGTEYECEKKKLQGSTYYGATITGTGADFSEYPFVLTYSVTDSSTLLTTQSAGTYTLKLEEPQSGGGDLSIATLTFTNGANSVEGAVAIDSPLNASTTRGENSDTHKIILYKGKAYINLVGTVDSTSGNITNLSGSTWIVTGDCTVTISGGED